MTARSNRSDSPTPRPLSNWIIAAGALVVLGVVAVIWFVLLRRYGGQAAQVQLDAIRTGGTLVIGTGGAVALLLTARRQRYTELALVHTDRDATERRITELYTKAADQLGSEQAPVRLAGLYALERLAHSTVEHRQTIVDVICAYLRMPYTPPPPSVSVLGGSREEHAEQERQVRLTAQNILVTNLRVSAQRRRRWLHRTPPPAVPVWPGIRLDLTGALLLEFSLAECQLNYADFTRAKFTGRAYFENVQFTGRAHFEGAQFSGRANFGFAQFSGKADFEGAQFSGRADFEFAQFSGAAFFKGAQFTDLANFAGAQFTGGAFFTRAQFTGGGEFGGVQFTVGAPLPLSLWTPFGYVRWRTSTSIRRDEIGRPLSLWTPFGYVRPISLIDFEGARVASADTLRFVWPRRWATRPAEPDNGEDPAFLYLTRTS